MFELSRTSIKQLQRSRSNVLSPEEWRRIEQVIDRVMDAPREERARYLDEACAGDTALRREAEQVLAASDAVGFLESPAAAFAAPLVRPAASHAGIGDATGAVVGPYRILAELGRGGMGAVFLAERTDGPRGARVALKIVKRGLDSGEVQRRFMAEREILGRLTHRNIARLLDGGVSADGRPYFAMEYVSGTSITAHADTRRLSVDERLRLFALVCEAVVRTRCAPAASRRGRCRATWARIAPNVNGRAGTHAGHLRVGAS